jgi:hypothetical protein
MMLEMTIRRMSGASRRVRRENYRSLRRWQSASFRSNLPSQLKLRPDQYAEIDDRSARYGDTPKKVPNVAESSLVCEQEDRCEEQTEEEYEQELQLLDGIPRQQRLIPLSECYLL